MEPTKIAVRVLEDIKGTVGLGAATQCGLVSRWGEPQGYIANLGVGV